MGNWTRVHIIGTCAAQDVRKLSTLLGAKFASDEWTCLCDGGICGLPNWAGESIDAIGNLGERDFDSQDVAEALEGYAKAAPSLTVKVHIGDDYEGDRCIATVTLAAGKATVGDPEISEIGGITKSQMSANFFRFL